MKLIGGRKTGRHQECEDHEQNASHARKSSTQSAPKKQRKDGVFSEVPQFPQGDMDRDNGGERNLRIEPAEERHDKARGMLSRESIRGTREDQKHPGNHWHPLTDESGGLCVQIECTR